MASPSASRPISPTPSQLPPMPGSPVYSVASTANPLSSFSLPYPPPPRPSHTVLTSADLERSQEAYSSLVASAKAYRLALASLSTAASSFGSALEQCARLKEARAEPVGPSNMSASFTTKTSACTADTLMSASGVQQLIANHQHILSETVYRSFEVPLLDDLDKWQTVMDDEKEMYVQRMKTQTKEIKRLEKEGMKLHKQRKRDVSRFRAHLVELTNKLDGLTTLHGDHARTLLRESQETSRRIVDASCSLVRAEVDIFESLARKGWSGGGLDDILEKGTDLFAADESGAMHSGSGSDTTAKLFSILPPKSILADSASDKSRPAAAAGPGHSRSDSLLVDTSGQYQSLTAVAESHAIAGDADSVMSTEFNKPRNARPFSPQPIRRIPTDVTFDSLGATAWAGESSTTKNGVDEEDEMQKSELRLPTIDGGITEDDEDDYERVGDGDGEDKGKEKSGTDTPEEARGRKSPDFITDESSPDSNR